MAEENILLALLAEQPEELDVLLVYADLLEEQGDTARATFLRLHRELLDWHHGTRGLIGRSRQLFRLGKSLPAEWMAVVSRPRLVGTVWTGKDSGGSSYVFRYRPGGVLNYTSPTGTFENGTWRQIGNHVAMEMNHHYADYEGFIAGDRIRGSARNITEYRWRWDVTRTDDPKLCRSRRAVRTVFDGDPPRRRKWLPQPDIVAPPTAARRRRSRGSGQ